jgi:predicted short-subunit dehydrogenase-like oxidoreductase (DUF2520 family)
MQSISFIGAGRLGQTLAVALSRAGWPVTAVASRSLVSARHLAEQIPGCQAVQASHATQADLVFLSVPDDAIAPLASELTWRAGQCVVHCSGATEVAALAPAAACGALIGGFHPLQIFSDPVVALENLPGSAVAIEAPPALAATLQRMATDLRMNAITLPAGSRALYHASAGYAASLMLPLLHEAVQLWRKFGVNEAQALQALLPLARGTLSAVQSKGVDGALSGPISRNDEGVVRAHLNALAPLGNSHLALYQELSRRQLPLALAAGRLDGVQLALWLKLLGADTAGQPTSASEPDGTQKV